MVIVWLLPIRLRCVFAERDFAVGQRRVHQKHQGGVAQFDGVFQTLFRSPRRVVEGFFQIDFGAAALIAGDFARVQFADDAVARPAVFEVFGFDEGVELILRVSDVVGDFNQADTFEFA